MYVDKQAEIAEILGITPTEVASIVGFYSLYYDEPKGKYHIQVCTDLPALKADKLCKNYARLNIKPAERRMMVW
jgi:NADH:ubiquinone oxidoreductase subunit E